jgi:hypothetical protein
MFKAIGALAFVASAMGGAVSVKIAFFLMSFLPLPIAKCRLDCSLHPKRSQCHTKNPSQLTSANVDSVLFGGKNAFVKFQAPW